MTRRRIDRIREILPLLTQQDCLFPSGAKGERVGASRAFASPVDHEKEAASARQRADVVEIALQVRVDREQ